MAIGSMLTSQQAQQQATTSGCTMTSLDVTEKDQREGAKARRPEERSCGASVPGTTSRMRIGKEPAG
ncbi:MAG: hypothetical protein ACRERC_01855, partial [Candidatus Binatia bacterium]